MAGAGDTKLPLSDVMMAMDVVDTLRHRDKTIERELAQGTRDEDLLARLRGIYANQGIDVPEHVLREGVAALKEDRFVYTPPPASLNVWLARLYINRMSLGKWVGAVALALIVAVVGWRMLVVAPREQAAEALRIELSEDLPLAFDQTLALIGQEADDPQAMEQANLLIGDGKAAAERGEAEFARGKLVDAKALLAHLQQTYEVRIVSRPGMQSGVERIPDVNKLTQNLYLIVEALDPDGKPLALPILNEEDGKTSTVSIWAMRVPEATFDAIKRDKLDDGIIQDSLLGVKKRGRLQPDWLMAIEPGAITKW